jgi:hypothetical protein|tara:strand:- start:217 stop:357 length:141 start_codon:yes stop_codon:yes gene_type:complete
MIKLKHYKKKEKQVRSKREVHFWPVNHHENNQGQAKRGAKRLPLNL